MQFVKGRAKAFMLHVFGGMSTTQIPEGFYYLAHVVDDFLFVAQNNSGIFETLRAKHVAQHLGRRQIPTTRWR